jgi:hypothetical protein
MIVRHQRAIVRDEVEQMRHLLQIGWHVGVVALEVGIIELNVDHMLDIAARRGEMATARGLHGGGRVEDDHRQTAKEHCGERRDTANASERMTPELPNAVHDPLSFPGPSILGGATPNSALPGLFPHSALLERRAGAVEARLSMVSSGFHGDVRCAHVWITAA